VWLADESPAAAKVAVLRSDFREPLWAVATWKEYAQYKQDGSPTRMWAQFSALMLAKCAESLALRKAFPQELSGLYTSEEMAQASNHSQTQPESPDVVEGTVMEPQPQKKQEAAPAPAPVETNAPPPEKVKPWSPADYNRFWAEAMNPDRMGLSKAEVGKLLDIKSNKELPRLGAVDEVLEGLEAAQERAIAAEAAAAAETDGVEQQALA
jgi:hypothetical protein